MTSAAPATALSREQLLRLIPHAGAMCLLDCVRQFSDEEILCETGSHADPSNPLRRGPALDAIHLAEYAAQAAAIHGALQAGGAAQPGKLAALRDIRLHVQQLQDIPGNLSVRAHRLLARREGSLYSFTISASDRLLCEGRLSIALE